MSDLARLRSALDRAVTPPSGALARRSCSRRGLRASCSRSRSGARSASSFAAPTTSRRGSPRPRPSSRSGTRSGTASSCASGLLDRASARAARAGPRSLRSRSRSLFVGYMLWAVAQVRLRELEVRRGRAGPHQDPDLDPAARASSLGVLIFFVAVARRAASPCCAGASPRTRRPRKSAARRATSRRRSDVTTLTIALRAPRAAARAARRRRVDRHRARGGRVVRAAVLHEHAAGSESLPGVLGLERELDDRRAAALRLDGRDPLPHASSRTRCSKGSRRGSAGCPGGSCT